MMSNTLRRSVQINTGRSLVMKLSSMSFMEKLQYLASLGSNVGVIGIKEVFTTHSYAREATIPKGLLVAGHVHKMEHVAIMGYGSMILWDSDEGTRHMHGYNLIKSAAGIRRIALVLEETKFVTLHHASDGVLDVFDYFTVKTHEEYLEYAEGLKEPQNLLIKTAQN